MGYVRVSTDEQANSGLSLAAQYAAIQNEAGRRGWDLVAVEEDAGASGKSLRGRVGVTRALARLRAREADALIVARLDRLSRSVGDFARLLEEADHEQWSLVCLDLAFDTSTPAGEAAAHMVAVFSQMERRLIGARTKEALQQAKARGVRLGGRRLVPADVEDRIVRRRKEGATLQAIADELNSDGIPSARSGGRWGHTSVRYVLSRHDAPTFPRGRRRP